MMFPRVIPFLIALALFFAGVLASSHVASVTPVNMHPVQELLSGDDQRSDDATTQAGAESLSDVPDLLVGPLAPPAAIPSPPHLQSHAASERVPPYLKGPLRPPSGSGLPA